MAITGKVPNDLTVLVVDDLQAMRRIIKNLMSQLGFVTFIEAESGAQALRELHARKIDLIVSDENMPEMMGIDLLDAVRADEDLKQIPFLMVTVESNRKQLATELCYEASDFIVKPFSPATLEEKLSRLL